MGASESKLAFKEDIFRLAGDENIPLESDWWLRVRIHGAKMLGEAVTALPDDHKAPNHCSASCPIADTTM